VIPHDVAIDVLTKAQDMLRDPELEITSVCRRGATAHNTCDAIDMASPHTLSTLRADDDATLHDPVAMLHVALTLSSRVGYPVEGLDEDGHVHFGRSRLPFSYAGSYSRTTKHTVIRLTERNARTTDMPGFAPLSTPGTWSWGQSAGTTLNAINARQRTGGPGFSMAKPIIGGPDDQQSSVVQTATNGSFTGVQNNGTTKAITTNSVIQYSRGAGGVLAAFPRQQMIEKCHFDYSRSPYDWTTQQFTSPGVGLFAMPIAPPTANTVMWVPGLYIRIAPVIGSAVQVAAPEIVLFLDAEDEGTQPVHYAQAASPPAPLSFITTQIGTGEIIIWGARLNDVAQLVPVSFRMQNAFTDNTANAAAQNIGANVLASGIPPNFVISIDPVNPSLANWGAIMDMIARW